MREKQMLVFSSRELNSCEWIYHTASKKDLFHDTRLKKNNFGSEMPNEFAECQLRLLLSDLEDITGCFARRLESQTFTEQRARSPGSVLLLLPLFFIHIISCL